MSNHLHPLHFCYTADPNQCPYGSFALVLFAYCYKKKSYKKEIFFISTSPNVVTLNWASVLDKKMKEQSLALYTRKQYPCSI
jgi:hypothetical protein